ncbi:hypothetical protein HMPREF9946_00620 [Acetobacteraceae bacterium AT-5844]|nr:hypothetical protein HMPREF9946_00620 [Acetobacteraceae bacterium AT-5844]
MPRLPILTALLCVAPFLLAAPVPAQQRDWLLSGGELLEALKGHAAPEIADAEIRRMVSSARAQAYILGVADGSHGAGRCRRPAMLPHEMADRVATHLQGLPAARLGGGAAPLVMEALPC